MPRGVERRLDDPEFEPGTVVGAYRVDRLIARGGMAAIYRATDTELGRPVALKVLYESFANDPASRGRFMLEWRVAAALRHPNIVAVHDTGEVGARLYLAMDLIGGGDLGRRLRANGPVPAPDAVTIMEQVAAALDTAHAAGLVHRDVKPGNILLDGERALLTDFGLAKLLASSEHLTAPGRMVGTIEYLSPEQIRGQQVTARTDVYGLGCVIFETLTATPPFEGVDFVVMHAHLEDEPPSMARRRFGIPAAADAVVRRAMQKLPSDRFESAGATVSALKKAFGYE